MCATVDSQCLEYLGYITLVRFQKKTLNPWCRRNCFMPLFAFSLVKVRICKHSTVGIFSRFSLTLIHNVYARKIHLSTFKSSPSLLTILSLQMPKAKQNTHNYTEITTTYYRGSSAYAVFETLEKQPCKQKTV